MGLTTPAMVQKLRAALHAKGVSSLLREPDAGNLHVRFDEREVETEQGRAREAPAHERAGRIGPPKPPRHFSTLLSVNPYPRRPHSPLAAAIRIRQHSPLEWRMLARCPFIGGSLYGAGMLVDGEIGARALATSGWLPR